MRLNLERIDASGLDLDLSPDLNHDRRIALGAVRGLRGSLSQNAESLRLADVLAESVVVSLLLLKFKSFNIELPMEGNLNQLSGSYERSPGSTELKLLATSLHAPRLALRFERFQAQGDLSAKNVKLHTSTLQSFVKADWLELSNLELSGVLASKAQRVVATDVTVTWGASGYRVEVGTLELPKTSVQLDMSGADESKKKDRQAQVEDSKQTHSEPTASRQSGAANIDWSVLDGLSGPLDVDVLVDMKVPVLGSRHAKHPLRISIQSGTLNYLELERDLSALEDSLVDFAVRDGDLVLERGIPLLPTRGRGKPIPIWPLNAEDFALTTENRVRLSVLPQARLATTGELDAKAATATKSDVGTEKKDPAVGLRELSFVNLQSLLRLDPTKTSKGPFRGLSFEELMLQGSVYHSNSGAPAREGELTGKLRALKGGIESLPLGNSHLDLGSLKLAELTNLSVQFRDIRPEQASFELSELRASSLVFGDLNP